MLVVNRKENETVVIGDDRVSLVAMSRAEIDGLREVLANTPVTTLIALGLSDLGARLEDAPFKPIEVRIVDVRGTKVRIGIDAPKSIEVHRMEIYQQNKRRNERQNPGKGGGTAIDG